MKSYVIDANVAIKWYVPEVLAQRAVYLLREATNGGVALFAPDLIWAELGNVLWKKLQRNELDAEIIRQILGAVAVAFPVETVPCSLLLAAAFEIASAFNRTVYDSLYIALAQSMQATFITADERLVNALGQTSLGPTIRFLGESDW